MRDNENSAFFVMVCLAIAGFFVFILIGFMETRAHNSLVLEVRGLGIEGTSAVKIIEISPERYRTGINLTYIKTENTYNKGEAVILQCNRRLTKCETIAVYTEKE